MYVFAHAMGICLTPAKSEKDSKKDSKVAEDELLGLRCIAGGHKRHSVGDSVEMVSLSDVSVSRKSPDKKRRVSKVHYYIS